MIENESTTNQNLRVQLKKGVFKKKFVAVGSCIFSNLALTLNLEKEEQSKPKASRWKEIIKDQRRNK